MELVTSHVGADFDALASMVAARKLYPQSVAAFAGGMDRNVREFVALFEESLNLWDTMDVDLEAVSRLIVVDTQHAGRLGRFASLVERGVPIHLFDHHPIPTVAYHDLLPAEYAVREPMGATTTLLLKLLRQRGLSISSFEATLFALGIYEETGGLVFSHTTVEDIEMAAYLLRQGANLDIVSDYIHRSLTEKQRQLLHRLILNAEYRTIHGTPIAVTQAETTEYVDEIALLVHKLCDIENVGAVFALIEAGYQSVAEEREVADKSVFLIARSKVDNVNVGHILQTLGGGGHHRAASAVLKHTDLTAAKAHLLAALDRSIPPQRRARDIMEFPVRTVSPETTIERAGRVMLRYGYSGLVVARNHHVEGIITRRDVDRAQHHGLHAAPVKALMTTEVPIASTETTLHELQEMMVRFKVGRIPVVEQINETGACPRLVGVVTRSGLLKALYGQAASAPTPERVESCLRREDIRPIVEQRLPPEQLTLLREVGEIGDELGFAVYLVGGCVRDILLGEQNLDTDIMVDALSLCGDLHDAGSGSGRNAIALASEFARRRGGRLIRHERFGTAVVILPDGQKVDFATARTEFYQFPAALPEVEFSSIQEDLYRRDFTINAMAIKLNPSNFGELWDFFGGRSDLEAGIVRVLHNLSFVEDPTRIIRAVRLEQRYGFKMDRHTEALISQAVDIEMFSRLTRERMRDELILLLEEPHPIDAIHRMAHLNILNHLHPRLRFDEDVLSLLHRVEEELRLFDHYCATTPPGSAQATRAISRWTLFFLPLITDLALAEVKALAQDLKLTTESTAILTSAVIDLPVVFERLSRQPPPSEVRAMLLPIPLETLLFGAARVGNEVVRQLIRRFIYQWREEKPDINGRMLIEKGVKPGPRLGRALEAALAAKLNGNVSSIEEQMEVALRQANG